MADQAGGELEFVGPEAGITPAARGRGMGVTVADDGIEELRQCIRHLDMYGGGIEPDEIPLRLECLIRVVLDMATVVRDLERRENQRSGH